MTKKIVLAYSGGLDTSVLLKWLKEKYQVPVIAFVADLGQGDEMSAVSRKASKTGADQVVITDLREEFARDYVFPMFRAGAIYESQYLLGTSIARPLIAKRQVEVARQESADAVAHGATGKGNDQVRFELTYAALAPEQRPECVHRHEEVAAVLLHHRQQQVAARVPAETRVLLERRQPRQQHPPRLALVARQRERALQHVARRQHAELVAELARAAAAVEHRHHGVEM